MPIRQYKCEACNHSWEHFEHHTTPTPTDCPSCKSDKIGKTLTVPGLYDLRGDGTYNRGLVRPT